MADTKQIHDFAVKWRDKFSDQNINYIELVDHYMADDCEELGFVMDCGHSFNERYREAAYDHKALARIIDDIDDIQLLGSAIYSQWRFFNHWAYKAEEILELKNRKWFILALSRMAMLTCENPLDMDDLSVFDGHCKSDVINRITVDYRRITKIKPGEMPDEAKWDYVTWDYSECLIIDRETDTIDHIQYIGTDCKVSHKYEVEGGIGSLFENFDAKDLFLNIAGNPDDVIDAPNDTRDYTITIDFKKKPQRVINGSYDKNGLPEDFAEFAETVFDFMRLYGLGEILDPSVYGKVKRRKAEYIYCSVKFNEGNKSYYYIADDDSIEVGDYVFVPAGTDDHYAVVEIVQVEYFDEENLPFPVENTKHIIGKCTDDDFDVPVIMTSEPLIGYTPKQIRQIYLENLDERNLAIVYAGVSNQTSWLLHDLDDDDCTEDTEQRYHEWSDLEEELRNIIFKILKSKNETEFERLVAEGKGYYNIVKPFMIRNGFIDGHGWWVKNTNHLGGLVFKT